MKKQEILKKILSYQKYYIAFSGLLAVLLITSAIYDPLKHYTSPLAYLFLIAAGFTILCESGIRTYSGKKLSFDFLPGLNFTFSPVIMKIVGILHFMIGLFAMLIGFLFLLTM
ncbi:MAG TPA: hypothetical protein P5120_18260 [Spirochaetota bacterium]|nr:hypothetical protein [Spirochaetota bacterium]HRX49472.1 hypothetical protein [Spirochaetota bacterium]